MQDKKFHAILCKNEIARQIANCIYNKEDINLDLLEASLIGIENYLGTVNQPSVEDIIENNTNKDKKFNI